MHPFAFLHSGVDPAGPLRRLRASQCFLFQRYYLGRPVPLVDFRASLDG